MDMGGLCRVSVEDPFRDFARGDGEVADVVLWPYPKWPFGFGQSKMKMFTRPLFFVVSVGLPIPVRT